MRMLSARFLSAFLPVLFLLELAPTAHAQCDNWLPGPDLAPAGTVSDSIVFDPDGAGPQPAQLIVCGSFQSAGSVAASNIASWDGSAWHALGAGLPGTNSEGHCLAIYNGQLIVGGFFTTAGTTATYGIARWDGSSWQTLGAGLAYHFIGIMSGSTLALTVFRGELIAAGIFDSSGTTPLYGLARWNGTSWSPLNPASVSPGDVRAVISYNNELIVGGQFYSIDGFQTQSIARWNGTSWSSWGQDFTTESNSYGLAAVQSFTIYNNELIVGGNFDRVGSIPAKGVAAYNGTTWRALGAGTDAGTWQGVVSLRVHNNQLIVGGKFNAAGGLAANNIAQWNGSNWSALGAGLGNQANYFETVSTATSFNGTLYAAGEFSSSGSVALGSIATWNGSAWAASPPGISLARPATVYALLPYSGEIVFGGTFHTAASSGYYRDDIIRWDGIGKADSWGSASGGPIRALKNYDTGTILNRTHHLIAGGDFSSIDTTAANRIIQRDESDIAIFPPPAWRNLGPGFNNTVYAIERHNNITYAAGTFTATGDSATSLSRIAQWNGTAWQPLGGGLNGTVYALRSFGGSLYAGGSFTSASNTATPVGSVSTGGLARWDGTRWNIVGGFFGGIVYALELHNSELIIGGDFPGINSDANLARYNGSAYSTFGSTPGIGGTNAPVRAILSESGNLYIGGDFTFAGGVSVNRLARWTGSAFDNVRGGANGPVYALAAYHGEVLAGGAFSNVKNGTLLSPGAARYLETGAPWIADQPNTNRAACPGRAASLVTRAASGYTPVSYSWRKNSVPLSDGLTPTGTLLSGTHASTLNLSGISIADNGTYDCIVSNSCGQATSFAAPFALCVADFNCDRMVTVQDIFDFLTAWFASSPAANINAAQGITVQDIFDFLSAWFTGC